MRLMLGICDHYAVEYSILFNAKKINVFHFARVMAIYVIRKIYQPFYRRVGSCQCYADDIGPTTVFQL